MNSLKFGTSGLRGLVNELSSGVCKAYTIAFLEYMQYTPGGFLLIGYDLRPSSPRIAAACGAAAQSFGMHVENCGPLPTPALACRALQRSTPAIMVTGSHIPADRNGLKFYRADGEINKHDEAGILKFFNPHTPFSISAVADGEISKQALLQYTDRCASILTPETLKGKRIGIYQHSSVARDLIVEILLRAGAETVALGRSDIFVPIDTEALCPNDIAFAKEACHDLRLDALVSTDGDADRPLIADENGNFLRGDIVGLLTAQFLNADAVVTPVTSSTAVELSGFFAQVYRTRVGSPYVLTEMSKAIVEGYSRIVGFEANGGVLLGSTIAIENRQIVALPTRDAMLPILSVLGMTVREGLPVSGLVQSLPARFTQSGRIESVSAEKSTAFLKNFDDCEQMKVFFSEIGLVEKSDAVDGVRIILKSGDVIHYRASGNAPELRCYTESTSSERAITLLNWGLERAKNRLIKEEFSTI